MNENQKKMIRRLSILITYLCIVVNFSFAQTGNVVSVSGRVFELKEPPLPLPGVTVKVSGTNNGTTTDPQGSFSLKNVPLNAKLEIKMVGYKIQTYIVRSTQASLIFSLEPDLIELDQVVVTGFGKQKRREIASSVSTINMNNIVDKPIVQLSQALQGGASGITVQQTSGVVGSDQANIRVRGIATLSNADPLVLIDGIPGNMNNLDATTVESISVLKDAASASMYGSRGANGVIMITTKRGKAGVVNVDYNGYYGIQRYLNVPDFVGAPKYMEMRNQMKTLDGIPPEFTQEAIDATRTQTDPANYPDTRWWDLVMRKNTPLQSHSLSASGGNTAARFAVNVNHTRQLGNLNDLGNRPASLFSRTTARVNTTVDLSKNFLVYTDIFASRSDQSEPFVGGADRNTKYLYGKVYAIPPTIVAVYPERQGVKYPEYITQGYRFYGSFGELWNPVASLEQAGTVRRANDQATLNIRPQWKINEEFTLNAQASYNVTSGLDLIDQKDFIFFDYSSYKPATNSLTSYGAYSNVKTATLARRSNYFYWGGNLDYKKAIGEHNINAILGYTQELETKDNWNNIALMSVFAKAFYTYGERYSLEAGIRRDGSSIFGPGHKWGNFPSVAAAWSIDKESFFKFKPVTAWKVRASYGILGNNRIDPYLYQNLIGTNGIPTIFGNADMIWEKTAMLNLATDITLLSGFDFTVEWYNKKTTDLLIRSDQLLSAGIGSNSSSNTNTAPYFNSASARIRGLDLSLKYTKVFGKDFRFNANFGYSKMNSKVLKVIIPGVPIISGNTIITEGGELKEYYGFRTNGLLQEADINDPGVLKFGVQKPGEIRFVDTDGNGVLNDDDRVPLGGDQFTDVFFGGFGFAFRNFDFDCSATGMAGKDVIFSGIIANPFQGNIGSSATPQWHQTDTWTPANTGAAFPRLSTATPRYSDYYLNSSDFLRIRYIQVGYTLPTTLVNKARIKNLRFYVNAQNPFTITKLKMVDPEITGELETVAPMKTFTFGLSVKF